MKYAIQKVDRHGRTRWYYHRNGGYWALPGNPEIHQTEYDQIAHLFAIGRPPARAMRKRGARNRPESAFTREVERAVIRAKQRASMWQRQFDLDTEWVREKIAEQRCCCALTGIPFSPTRAAGERNPYAPSLDRIDCGGGYTKDNVRIVLLSVNLALADWGEEHFAEICAAFLAKKSATL